MTTSLGSCPNCHVEITSEDAVLPARCPHCDHRLRPVSPGFWSSVANCLCQYATFRGRATRAEYWWFALFTFIFGYVVNILSQGCLTALFMTYQEELQTLSGIRDGDVLLQRLGELSPNLFAGLALAILLPMLCQLALMLPSLAVSVRRMHDTGRSGVVVCCVVVLQILLAISAIYAVVNILSLEAQREALEGAEVVFDAIDGLLPFVVMALLFLLLLASGIYLLVCSCLDSRRGPNQYGPSAKYPQA